MIRTMASDVDRPFGLRGKWPSVHSGVSSAPSKIPYGGFSPVRLQAGCQMRPSPSRDGFDAFTVEVSSVPGLFRNRAFRPAAFTASDTTHRPSGPWLRQRLFCPPASSLTMATSEVLLLRPSFGIIPRALGSAELPQFTPHVFRSCRTPYPGGLPDALDCFFPGSDAFAIFVEARHRDPPALSEQQGRLTRLQVSLYVATRSFACAAPPARLQPSSRPHESLRGTWVMTKRATVHSRGRTLTGQTRGIMGCTRRERRAEKTSA
jgi:hypothetical protein